MEPFARLVLGVVMLAVLFALLKYTLRKVGREDLANAF